MEHFVKGLLFGMVLQISVGPVCIAVLQKGITESFWEAFLMVWGAVAADTTYILLALLGISRAMQLESVRIIIGLAGAALLLYFGIQNLMTEEATFEHRSADSKRGGSFRYGFLLTFSNPLTILFWAGVFGGLIASTQFPSPDAVHAFALGCIFSTLIFLTGIATLGRFVGTFLQRPSLLIWLNRAVGIFLIAFAAKLTLDVCSR